MSTPTTAGLHGSAVSAWGAQAHRRRALALLAAGFVTTNVVAAICAVAFLLARGQRGLASSLLAAGVVVLCFSIAQGVQVIVANAAPWTVLLAAMASYLLPLAGLGVAMWFAAPHLRSGRLDTAALIGTLVPCVIAWTGGMIAVFRRLHFPVHDCEYTAPGRPGAAA